MSTSDISSDPELSNLNEKIAPAVDYNFWSRMSGWTAAEAAALFLNLDPDQLPNDLHIVRDDPWSYNKLQRALERAVEMDELSSPMFPRDFLTWARSNRLKPPQALENAVQSGKPQRNWRSRYSKMRRNRDQLLAQLEEMKAQHGEELHPGAQKALTTIIGALIRKHLKHVKGDHNTVSKIKKIADEFGLTVSDNTIRKYVTASDEF